MYVNTTEFSTTSAPSSISNVLTPSSSLTTVNATRSEPRIQELLPNTQPPSGDPFAPTPSASVSLHASTTTDVLATSTNRKRGAPDTADALPGPSRRRRRLTEKAALYAASMKLKKRRKSAAVVHSDEENEWEDI